MSVLTVKNLHVMGKKAMKGMELKDFSLEIGDGDVVVLTGDKAPLVIAALVGGAKVLSGEIYVGDYLLPAKSKLVDYHVEFIPCDEDHYLGLAPKKPVKLDFMAPLKKRKVPAEEIKNRMETAARCLDISHLLDRKPRALSSQQKVRTALGAAATRFPRLVVMENIFSISTPEYQQGISEALKATLKALNLTVLFYTTSDKAELAVEAGVKMVEVN